MAAEIGIGEEWGGGQAETDAPKEQQTQDNAADKYLHIRYLFGSCDIILTV